MFLVEKNLPIPKERTHPKKLDEKTTDAMGFLLDLQIGDSFLVPPVSEDGELAFFVLGRLRRAANLAGIKLRSKSGKRHSGSRVWRVE